MRSKSYSLNLSPRYAPTWTAWECAREVICNAIDAAKGQMKITPDGEDRLTVWTPTVPDLSQLFVIGQGTKNAGGSTIGQFGEGLKMAALVASRSVRSSIEFHLPTCTVTFGFKKVHDSDVLHAFVKPAENPEGFSVVIAMPGVANTFEGRILDETASKAIEKEKGGGLKVFCKGVFITELSVSSIWNWNLNSITINRDRSMVDPSSLHVYMAQWLVDHGTDEHYEAMLKQPTTIEGSGAMNWVYNDRTLKRMAKKFTEVYGEKAVLETDDSTVNAKARVEGFELIRLSDHMRRRLSTYVQTAQDVVPKNHDIEAVDIEPHKERIKWLRQLDEMVAAPEFSVRVFANRQEAQMGRAVIEDYQVWLNESLFAPGNELNLVRTYLHEVAHLCSSALDCTRQFENALDGMAGHLGLRALEALAKVEA